MILDRITPIGYCKGVYVAINTLLKAASLYKGQPIYCIGQIVHNDYINHKIEQSGVKILLGDKEALIQSISSGVVIFSAHGTDSRLIQKAKDKGLTVIDTTCEFVKKGMNIISSYINNGYDVIYIGVKNHPESEAAVALSNRVHLITCKEDLDNFHLTNDKLILINQTTISIHSLVSLYSYIKKIYPNALLIDEICNATRIRQEAILNLSKSYDGVLIVGDIKSNNTKSLKQMAEKNGFDTKMCNSYSEEIETWAHSKNKIAILSGTSTPIELVDEIEKKLKF